MARWGWRGVDPASLTLGSGASGGAGGGPHRQEASQPAPGAPGPPGLRGAPAEPLGRRQRRPSAARGHQMTKTVGAPRRMRDQRWRRAPPRHRRQRCGPPPRPPRRRDGLALPGAHGAAVRQGRPHLQRAPAEHLRRGRIGPGRNHPEIPDSSNRGFTGGFPRGRPPRAAGHPRCRLPRPLAAGDALSPVGNRAPRRVRRQGLHDGRRAAEGLRVALHGARPCRPRSSPTSTPSPATR